VNINAKEELKVARSLLRVIKSGVNLVDQTFYNNPDPAEYTSAKTGKVVDSMRIAIALYEAKFGRLEHGS
jgi:hypothetical protein